MNRRSFLGAAAAPLAFAQTPSSRSTVPRVDVLRRPDVVGLRSSAGRKTLTRSGDRWEGSGVEVTAEPRRAGSLWEVPVTVSAHATEVEHVCLRWRGAMSEQFRYLGDHWERSYGDLEWRAGVSERPALVLRRLRPRCRARLWREDRAAAFCFWQADPAGISLWLDLRNGGSRYAPRRSPRWKPPSVRATPAARPARRAFQTARALCRDALREAAPRRRARLWRQQLVLRLRPQLLGRADILRDSGVMAEAAPSGAANRPFMVIDDGLDPITNAAGPGSHGNAGFPDMAGLAAEMEARASAPASGCARCSPPPRSRPDCATAPRAGARDRRSIPASPRCSSTVAPGHRAAWPRWGYELIKHDYSTLRSAGPLGLPDGRRAHRSRLALRRPHAAPPPRSCWHLYRAIREAAGDGAAASAATPSATWRAGLFEAAAHRRRHQRPRLGPHAQDGRQHPRRSALRQHNAFFAADADCVADHPRGPLGPHQPLARPGGAQRDRAVRFGRSRRAGDGTEGRAQGCIRTRLRPQPEAEPLDWFETTAPMRWRFGKDEKSYQWYGDEGASPFAG